MCHYIFSTIWWLFISDGDCIVLTLTRLGGKTTVFKVFDGGILIITLGQSRNIPFHKDMPSISGSCTNTQFENTELNCKNDSYKNGSWLLYYLCVRGCMQTFAVLICFFSFIPEANCILIVVRGGQNQQVFKIQDGLVVHIKPGHISIKHFSWTVF